MAPERGICRVLATSQAVILCAMIHKNTQGGYNYALNLVKMAIRLHIHDFGRQCTRMLSFLHTPNSSCPSAYGNGNRRICHTDCLLPGVIYL